MTHGSMDRRKTVYLHIGAGKSASTSIQAFLSANSERLRARGIVHADQSFAFRAGRGHPVRYFHEGLRQPQAPSAAFLSKTRAAIEAAPSGKILISAESLFHVKCAPYFAESTKGYDVRLLMFIRRQDDYLYSAWKQWRCKRGWALEPWIDHALAHGRPPLRAVRDAWAAVFGAEAITVHSLDFPEDYGDVFSAVLDWLGVEGDRASFIRPAEWNASVSYEVAEFFSRHPQMFDGPHDTRAEELFKHHAPLAIMSRDRIPVDLSARIITHFAEENADLLGPAHAARLTPRVAPADERTVGRGPDSADFVLACMIEMLTDLRAQGAFDRPEGVAAMLTADGRPPLAARSSGLWTRIDATSRDILAAMPFLGSRTRARLARSAAKRRSGLAG